ncbi:uncharacterized protein LOC110985595 isoform X2 [Acanthaster planci]|nr:uncharacterized protein LOC110985595 isoform X2 [Acanthaster planci]
MAERNPRLAQESHQVDTQECGDHVYLPPVGFGRDPVDFNADLNDIDGCYVFQNIIENGLAFAVGVRNGDILFGINGTNIEGRGIEYVLDLLRTNHGYQVPQLLLAVQRNSKIAGEPPRFIWVIFKTVFQVGDPTVEVIQTLETDTTNMPFFVIQPTFSWLGPPVDPVNVYTEGEHPLYLCVKDDKIAFANYSPNSALFLYKYSGGNPGKGNAVAYSLQSLTTPPLEHSTPAGTTEDTLKALNFPSYMTGGKGIPKDPRLWYNKTYKSAFSLESVMAEGMYLGMGETGEAMLSKKKTEMKVNIS